MTSVRHVLVGMSARALAHKQITARTFKTVGTRSTRRRQTQEFELEYVFRHQNHVYEAHDFEELKRLYLCQSLHLIINYDVAFLLH